MPVFRDTTTMLSWEAWWAAAGIAEPPPTHGPVFGDPGAGVRCGDLEQGVLLAVDMMSADAVSDGRLVRPFDIPAQCGVQYWLATAQAKRESRKLRLFRQWLLEEVPDLREGYVRQQQRREK